MIFLQVHQKQTERMKYRSEWFLSDPSGLVRIIKAKTKIMTRILAINLNYFLKGYGKMSTRPSNFLNCLGYSWLSNLYCSSFTASSHVARSDPYGL